MSQYDSTMPANQAIAVIIRAQCSGLCSGEPSGVTYPGIPCVQDIATNLNIDLDMPLSEDQWVNAWEFVETG